MIKRAKATVSGGDFNTKLGNLADAISAIEGGSAANPGNIRDSAGNIGATGSLSHQLDIAFVSQTSAYYTVEMTFREFAWMYVSGTTPGDWPKVISGDNPDTWATFVAGRLGVSPDSRVWDYLNS